MSGTPFEGVPQAWTSRASVCQGPIFLPIKSQQRRPFEVAHLPLESGDPMADGVLPPPVRAVFQAAQGEGFCRREIAHAMLVVNRQRGARFAGDAARTLAGVEDLPPATRRTVVRTRAAEDQRERAQGFHTDGRG